MKREKDNGLEELALVSRAAQGDHEAFRCLVLSYEPRLLAYLTQMLGDPETARDVAQETFVAVFHGLPTWRPLQHDTTIVDDVDETFLLSNPAAAHPLAPWLYRIATNRALSVLRKQAVRQRRHAYAPHEATLQEHEPWKTEPKQGNHSMEDRYVARELLREALSHLAEEDAACLILHFVAGERYGEIAARLGLTGEAVRKRVARALVALRQAYTALDMEIPYVYAFNAKTGVRIWTSNRALVGFFSDPVVANGIVYLGSQEATGGNVYALRASDGSQVWHKSLDRGR